MSPPAAHAYRPAHRQCHGEKPVPFFSVDSSNDHVAMASSLSAFRWPVSRRCKRQLGLLHVHGDDPWIDLHYFHVNNFSASATTWAEASARDAERGVVGGGVAPAAVDFGSVGCSYRFRENGEQCKKRKKNLQLRILDSSSSVQGVVVGL